MNVARHLRHLGYVIASVVLLASLVGAQAVDAATYYVATTGSDANPGTEAAPFRTLNKGVTGLKPGDTLYVKSGTYAEALIHKIPGGTSWSNPVTVAAYPGHTVTIRPPASNSTVLRFASSSHRYIEVRGFILDGVNVSDRVIKITWSGNSSNLSSHIRIRDAEVKNAPNTGIGVGGCCNEFINLKVHSNGDSKLDHGFYISSTNNLVENSDVYQNSGYGVHIYASGSSTASNNNVVRNNRVFNNGAAGAGGAGILLASGSGSVAYNNLVWGNPTGITVHYNGSNAKVYNNTVYSNKSTGILIGTGGSNARVQNNISYGNGGPAISNSGSGTVLSHNLVDVDPKFVNASAANFRLQSSSPAINKGMTLSEVRTDYAGVARPQGGSYDIGGYEYTGSTSVTAPINLRITTSK